jgi:hypothetical protein
VIAMHPMKHLYDTCGLVVVGASQPASSDSAPTRSAEEIKCPPSWRSGVGVGWVWDAVNRLFCIVVVEAIDAVERRTSKNRGRRDRHRWHSRRIGQSDTGRRIAHPRSHHGDLANRSLHAAFIGENGVGVDASKRAVGLWLQ